MRYVALLRGINVGGKNIIRMADLKSCFEDLVLKDVSTFIQSGNVLFSASIKDSDRLAKRIEQGLSEAFGYDSRVVIVSHDSMRQVVESAPKRFGADPEKFRYDVIFLKPPLTAMEALKQVSVKEGVDTAHQGNGVVYFSRLISRDSQSHLSRIVQQPVYQHMTIRNWNTTTKLLELMNA
jgi:uncharacterized protein (DUF1697 family)